MNKRAVWLIWVTSVLVLSGYYSFRLFASEDQQAFVIGPATHGHHQIELACATCHTSAFGGGEVLQQACVNCHGEELQAADDSHPKAKFTDPRNADRLEHLDARQCVTCHREHQLEQTGPMGVTLPQDFCFLCHQDIAEDRPSHQGMAFDTCASAGCHNYHDNQALYEDFLTKHAQEPDIKAVARILQRSNVALKHPHHQPGKALRAADADAGALGDTVMADWLSSAHAQAGVNCSGCHTATPAASAKASAPPPQDWVDKPSIAICQGCHGEETATFYQGKHGMRLAPNLSRTLTPMTPSQGRLTFNPDAAHRELTCASCHDPHSVDVRKAAVESCLGCHADDHSLAFKTSPHFQLWQAELAGTAAPGSGVSCATCHMPRESHTTSGMPRVRVNHNQNANLRPNEKMIRGVCQNCHGLTFAIDALADPHLLQTNFAGRPAHHIDSVDLATRRLRESNATETASPEHIQP